MRTIIFDLDGTLLDVRQAVYWQFQELSKEFDGQPVQAKAIDAVMGGTTDDITRHLIKNRQVPFQDIVKRHNELRTESRVHRKLYTGTEDLLKILHNLGFKVAALTSGNHQTLACLDDHSIRHYFHEIISCYDVANHKPHPEGIELILKRLGTKRHKAVMIGDTVNDILAGKNGRVGKIIGVTHGFGNEAALREAGAHHLVHDLPSILDVLE